MKYECYVTWGCQANRLPNIEKSDAAKGRERGALNGLMEREQKSNRGSCRIVPSACEWASPGEISFEEINDLSKADCVLHGGRSLLSTGLLSPLLFVLHQILNVHMPPLAILCMSACLNIIISGRLGSIWWKVDNQRTREGDYIKKRGMCSQQGAFKE